MYPFMRNFEVKMDSQHRFTLPMKLRDAIGETAFIYKPPEYPCLYIYNEDTWEIVYNERVRRTKDYPDGEKQRRKFVSRMKAMDVDLNYKLTIPLSMVEAAGLKKDIVILGSGKHIELWDAKTFREQVENYEDETDSDAGYVM